MEINGHILSEPRSFNLEIKSPGSFLTSFVKVLTVQSRHESLNLDCCLFFFFSPLPNWLFNFEEKQAYGVVEWGCVRTVSLPVIYLQGFKYCFQILLFRKTSLSRSEIIVSIKPGNVCFQKENGDLIKITQTWWWKRKMEFSLQHTQPLWFYLAVRKPSFQTEISFSAVSGVSSRRWSCLCQGQQLVLFILR